MDKFLIKKRQREDSTKECEKNLNQVDCLSVNMQTSSEKVTASFSQSSSHPIQNAKKKVRLYSDSYLNLGFTWCGDKDFPKPKCVVCGDTLANEAMAPSKLKRHLFTKHTHLSDKPRSYFERCLNSQEKQSRTFTKMVKISDKAQEASYLVAEIIAKNMKPHTEAENVILPSCIAIVKTNFGTEAENDVKKIPLSDNTISRRITDMSRDIEENLISIIKKSDMFTIQVDESTDIANKDQLLVFVRFIYNKNIANEFLCCKELEKTTTGKDIFNTVNCYLEMHELKWDACIGICTDGAPSMIGSIKGFITLAKERNINIITTHCFLHREVLIGKTLNSDLKSVLDAVVKMVNFIKSRPLKSRLFTSLCEEAGAKYVNLLLHTEARWLSRGKVLTRVFQMRNEMKLFFIAEEKEEFSCLLGSSDWCSKLAYLVDVFEILNTVNTSMQDKEENILSSTDKIKSLQDKLNLWLREVKKGNVGMFKHFSSMVNLKIMPLISEHLQILLNNISYYFPSLSVEDYDWIRNPFIVDANEVKINVEEQEALIDLKNDGNLKMKYKELTIDEF